MTIERHRGCLPLVTPIASPSESDVDADRVRAFLRDQARILQEQKDEVAQTIRRLETNQTLVAVVLKEKCAGCGRCADICPANAIRVDGHAIIDDELYVGCCHCVSECPGEAIILESAART